MIDIRLPNITATDPAAQMSEVRSYLYQMVEQLNWALNTLDTGSTTQSGDTVVVSNGSAGAGSGSTPSEVFENFGSLKSLIIKTAQEANSEIGRLDDAIANLKLSNKAIDSVSESYYKSTSPTELKGGSWVDKYPGWEQGTYIWTRSTITYSDGSAPTVTEPICVTGNGIAGVDVEYRLSDSDTELTGDYEWQTSIDTIPEECSLWTRNKITYTNGDVAYTAECCISRYNIDTVIKAIRDAVTEGTQGVYAYMESQQAEYEGLYYASSDFGEFLEKYAQVLSIDPTKVEQAYNDTQILRTETESIREAIISTNANIKTGILYYDDDGVPIYGVEVGQTTEVNGEKMFNRFARFTSGRLSFYDANGSEVAYISDYKLYITNAQILGNLYLGSYILDTTNGIAFIWNG